MTCGWKNTVKLRQCSQVATPLSSGEGLAIHPFIIRELVTPFRLLLLLFRLSAVLLSTPPSPPLQPDPVISRCYSLHFLPFLFSNFTPYFLKDTKSTSLDLISNEIRRSDNFSFQKEREREIKSYPFFILIDLDIISRFHFQLDERTLGSIEYHRAIKISRCRTELSRDPLVTLVGRPWRRAHYRETSRPIGQRDQRHADQIIYLDLNKRA